MASKSTRGSPKYTIRLPKPLEARLKAYMKEKGLDEFSPVIRDALDEYLTRQGIPREQPQE